MLNEIAPRTLTVVVGGSGSANRSKCPVTPPSIDRQHSYSTRPTDISRASDASAVLASVASRATSPPRKDGSEPRTSWEACTEQRAGYISFPDFDLLRAENKM